jgi:hypothetical protein
MPDYCSVRKEKNSIIMNVRICHSEHSEESVCS